MKKIIKRFYRNYINNSGIYGINTTGLPKTAPKALIIYVNTAVAYFVKNDLQNFPLLNSHSGYWESVELIKQLNNKGFIVDIINHDEKYFNIHLEKYNIIFDIADNLGRSNRKISEGQIKIFYANSCHWLYHNLAELNRIKEFYKREGLLIKPKRYLAPFYSDLHADYITTFASETAIDTFVNKNKKAFFPLNISCTYIPDTKLSLAKSKNKFLWFGGSGILHKGLDLAIEAFRLLPEAELNIIGNVDQETDLFDWFKTKIKPHSNIIYHGWMEVGSASFNKIVSECVAVVYPSCAEGGAGSVAQVLHYGLIPVITKSSCCVFENLGYVIDTEEPDEIIKAIIPFVKQIMSLSDEEINKKVLEIKEHAAKKHTREAYSNSVKLFLDTICKTEIFK